MAAKSRVCQSHFKVPGAWGRATSEGSLNLGCVERDSSTAQGRQSGLTTALCPEPVKTQCLGSQSACEVSCGLREAS